MNRLILADTGPIYATNDPQDQFHARAQSELRLLRADGWRFGVATSTLVECHGLILRWLGIVAGRRWLAEIREGAVWVEPSTEDFATAIQLLDRFPDQDVSLADAVLAVLSQRIGAPIWTFDHHFDVMRADVWR